jgi:adenine-specific DNA-methyltransferase
VSYRYIGNKTRLAGFLVGLVADRVPRGALVADLMCGTGSVAAALRQSGFKIYAADVMTYAYLHARVRLTMAREPQFRKFGGTYGDVVTELNALPPRKGLFHREYSPAGTPEAGCSPRMYFTPENSGRMDAVLKTIWEWRGSGLLSSREFDLLRHDCVLAGNRVANIAGTYGHYRSTWSPAALEKLTLRKTVFEAGSTDHAVHQGPAEHLAQGLRADLCYLDPPYTKRQYAANYHIPETVARGDKPVAVGVSGLRPWRDQYSDFCSKVRVRGAFEAIITGMECPRYLISYSEDGLLSKHELFEFLSNFGSVSVEGVRLQRFRSNASSLGRYVSEFVFDLQKR